jgi:DNA-binding transcriptional LysR family regulator
LQDSGLIARKLGTLPLVNCASPAYLQKHGTPHSLDDLDQHLLAHYSPTLGGSTPGFEYHDGERHVLRDMRAVVTVNSADAYEAACLAGLGLIQAPRFGMQELLAQGRLVEVLPALAGAPMPVSLLYPHRRQLSKRVEAFMGWLGEVMAPIVHPA